MANEVKEGEAPAAPAAPPSPKKPMPLTVENVGKVLAKIKSGEAPTVALTDASLSLTYLGDAYAARTSADAEALREAFSLGNSCVDALPMGSQRVTFTR